MPFLFLKTVPFVCNNPAQIYCTYPAFFQVSVVGETINHSGHTALTPVKVPQSNIAEDFGSLLERKAFCDVILIVGNEEFPVHKAILAGQ